MGYAGVNWIVAAPGSPPSLVAAARLVAPRLFERAFVLGAGAFPIGGHCLLALLGLSKARATAVSASAAMHSTGALKACHGPQAVARRAVSVFPVRKFHRIACFQPQLWQ
jgi:hypothetical protein